MNWLKQNKTFSERNKRKKLSQGVLTQLVEFNIYSSDTRVWILSLIKNRIKIKNRKQRIKNKKNKKQR